MPNVVGIETMQLDRHHDDHVADYAFDLRPEYLDPEQFWVAIFKASEVPGNELRGWVSQYPRAEGEYTETTPYPRPCAFEDNDNRPSDSPLRVRKALEYLEPRYGDAWLAFVIERQDPA